MDDKLKETFKSKTAVFFAPFKAEGKLKKIRLSKKDQNEQGEEHERTLYMSFDWLG